MKAEEMILKAPHDFPRTSLWNLERAGLPRSTAMKLVGHKTKSAHQLYTIVVKQDLIDGVNRLAEQRTMVRAESKNEEDVSGSLL
jgi:hypothetical protein